jgi:hypothetical protein
MHQSAVNTTPQSSKEVKITLLNPIGVIKI